MLSESSQGKRWTVKENEAQTSSYLLIVLFSKHLQFKLLKFVPEPQRHKGRALAAEVKGYLVFRSSLKPAYKVCV